LVGVEVAVADTVAISVVGVGVTVAASPVTTICT
jgi:hypothetical protein